MARTREIKRRNCDPVMAHERGIKAGTSRTTTDYFVRKLTERAATLTPAQLQELAAIFRAAGWARLPAPGDGDHDDEG
jgi:hypothetical protein